MIKNKIKPRYKDRTKGNQCQTLKDDNREKERKRSIAFISKTYLRLLKVKKSDIL
jgi:hypothetical protein